MRDERSEPEAGGTTDAPRTGTPPRSADQIETRWQDRWAHERHLRGAEPDRPAGRRLRAGGGPTEAVRARHVPLPVRRRAPRRPPARLHRHRRVRPLQAHERPQRPAHDRVRRLRAARRAVRGARPARTRAVTTEENIATSRASCAVSAWPTTTGAASPPPTRPTTAGRSGSSCRSSTAGTTPRPSRARPIAELESELEAGTRPRIPARTPRARRGPTSSRRASPGRRRAPPRLPLRGAGQLVPGLGTVLANEEVTADGRSDRGNFPVFRRPLKQWMMRITAYADRLIARPGPARLDRLHQADAAELDRAQRGRRGPLRHRRRTDHRLHHAARHAVRRHVHGAGARAPARRRARRGRLARRRRSSVDRRGGQPGRRGGGLSGPDRAARARSTARARAGTRPASSSARTPPTP